MLHQICYTELSSKGISMSPIVSKTQRLSPLKGFSGRKSLILPTIYKVPY